MELIFIAEPITSKILNFKLKYSLMEATDGKDTIKVCANNFIARIFASQAKSEKK